MKNSSAWCSILKSFFGFVVGLSLALTLTALAGENPLHVLVVLMRSSFGSSYDFGLVLFYTTSLVFTGLAVCLPFQAGLFNIGAEGQLTMGALTMAAVGILWPALAFPWAPLLAVLAGVFVAGLWGFIPGWLRASRGSHEVIVTMMFNFIAAGASSYFIVGALKSTDSQNPETASIGAGYLLKNIDPIHGLSPDSPFNSAFLIAILMSFITWLLLNKTVWGYELKAVGLSPEAASTAGINAKKYRILSMILAGGFAGLVGLNEILGSAGKFRLGFSPDYGFMGIAVALLARNNPLGIIFSAFLFGALQKGATDLDLETATITRDFAKILQAIIILSVAGFYAAKFLDSSSENSSVLKVSILTRIKKWLKKA